MEHNLWGLTYDRSKGRWKFRPTIHRGRKMVGKRINVALSGCTSLEDAIAARDAALEALLTVGLTVSKRIQRRSGANTPTSC